MSTRFLDALHSGRVILMDGAMGTELIRRGLDVHTERSSDWNLNRKEDVLDIHESYLAAGADCLLTNSFVGPSRPNDFGGFGNFASFAVELAGRPDKGHFVLLDSGPDMAAVASALLLLDSNQEVHVDGLLVETLNSLNPVNRFLRLKESPVRPCIVSFSFRRSNGNLFCEKDDTSPEVVAGFINENCTLFAALGVNCGRDMDMDAIIEVVRRYRKVTDLPILARPNAGTPIRMGDRWVYPHSPKAMAVKLPELIEAGATLIGGCCGTTPAHIAAFREVIDKMGVAWEPDGGSANRR